MKTLITIAAALALVGCAAPAPNSEPASRPGSEAVYERNESLSDCVELQREFDTAAANGEAQRAALEDSRAATSYMEAAQARAEEVGCF